jgi:hypothetical protein
LGWTVKPFGEIWHHPILTPGGATYFWSEFTKSLWRGEIAWHRTTLAFGPLDLFYAVSSLALAVPAAVLLMLRRDRGRYPYLAGTLLVALSIVLLAVLSMVYDFGDCFYPSRDVPYIVSARLVSGMMVPFILLYLSGLDILLSRIRLHGWRWAFTAALLVGVTVSEVILSLPVFGSAFNIFHMF